MGIFTPGIPIFEIIGRTFVIYFVVLTGFRLSGKREIGQFTPFDLVLILLIANAVQNAMTGPDSSLVGGIAAAATLLLVNVIVTAAADRYRFIRGVVAGTPTVLVSGGKVIESHMSREHVTSEDLEAAMREHGVDKIFDVQIAVLETDGSISIVPVSSQVLKTRKRIKFLQRKQ